MKRKRFLIGIVAALVLQTAVLSAFLLYRPSFSQDTVAVNEVRQSVQADWGEMERHRNRTDLEYVVLDGQGTVLFRTGQNLSESINAAVLHGDVILDVEADGETVGKIILYSSGVRELQKWKQTTVLILSAVIFVQLVICAGYVIYLECALIRPFQRLKGFARRIAGGDLDVPLEMDRHNFFGAFTESFDMMRAELKRARAAEAEANAARQELVARLSHDIRTPVASIRAASEVGTALAADEKLKELYTQITRKADQIDALVTDLFTAALEDLQKLPVMPVDMESGEVKQLLENADYRHRAQIPPVPGCLIYADKLRLQQVFDNIFANSYKYADTEIDLSVRRTDGWLVVETEDCGGGVSQEELPFLKEKFRRGSNAEGIEGAGLGLYISDLFLREMKGKLLVENGKNGLKVTVVLALSGFVPQNEKETRFP